MRKVIFIFVALAVLCAPTVVMAKSPRFSFSFNLDCLLPPPPPCPMMVPAPYPSCSYEQETVIRERHDCYGRSTYHEERRVYPTPYCDPFYPCVPLHPLKPCYPCYPCYPY